MEIRYDSTYADKLKDVIDKTGWKQVELADLLGVGQKTISYWIRGIKAPGKMNSRCIDLLYHRIIDDKLPVNKDTVAAIRKEIRSLTNAASDIELTKMKRLTE